ncbi:MAG TPA: DUF2240 family protein [Candidatus Lokiarchaeia archaeon]|nr:DUF2240 family protein [Candidatus Lokiarchaeia archaeon]
MPLFQFEPPSNMPDLVIYSWQCLGKEAPSIPDLKYFMSFRAKLMLPSKAQEFIEAAIQQGLLVNASGKLALSSVLQDRVANQEHAEKVRVQQQLQQETTKASALGAKSFNDYFRELLPEEYKNKTFLIPLNSIQVDSLDLPSGTLHATVSNGDDVSEIAIDGVSKRVTHTCEALNSTIRETRHFCHHLGAFFRFLQKKQADLALRLARSMVEERDAWSFEENK